MLKIRPEQMAVFQQAADGAFTRRVAEHLREQYAEARVLLPAGATTVRELPNETLRELVRGGVARAREHGLRFESSLAAFVAIMFEYAPNFDAHPLARQILEDEEVSADARLDRLLDAFGEGHWAEVREGYDAGAWGLKSGE